MAYSDLVPAMKCTMWPCLTKCAAWGIRGCVCPFSGGHAMTTMGLLSIMPTILDAGTYVFSL
jgi:hypothetical protein